MKTFRLWVKLLLPLPAGLDLAHANVRVRGDADKNCCNAHRSSLGYLLAENYGTERDGQNELHVTNHVVGQDRGLAHHPVDGDVDGKGVQAR